MLIPYACHDAKIPASDDLNLNIGRLPAHLPMRLKPPPVTGAGTLFCIQMKNQGLLAETKSDVHPENSSAQTLKGSVLVFSEKFVSWYSKLVKRQLLGTSRSDRYQQLAEIAG
ncbi:hypothetical protein C8R44DRAFT_749744 [Mycena epipterygia]|nr:hypothetical protein C8R44DRAFT_749744 [Mycena epipterygia]